MSTSSSHEPLRLSADDLYSPRVDAFLDEQAVLNRALPEVGAAAVDRPACFTRATST